MATTDRPRDDDLPELERRVLADYGWVRALAARLLRSERDAEDVTQEVVAAALARKPHVEPQHGIRRWLDTVTRRQVARWRARRRRQQEVEAEAPATAADAPQPFEVVARLQMHRALTNAVLELPDPYRAVLVARYLDGLSNAQIAELRGEREATIRQQHTRAIQKLRGRLDREHGRDGRSALALLAFGGRPLAPAPSTATSAPASSTLAIPAALLTMKTLVTVLITICIALTVWQLALRPPERSADERAEYAAKKARAAALQADVTADLDDQLERTPAPAAASPSGFALRVVDHTGAPIRGATVVLCAVVEHVAPDDFELRTTDENGRVDYVARPPAPCEHLGYRLLLAAESRAPEWQHIDLPQPGSERTVRFGGPGSVSGVVAPIGDVAALGRERDERPRWLFSMQHRFALDCPAVITASFVNRGMRELLQAAIRVDPTTGAFAMHGLPASVSTLRVGLRPFAPFVIHPDHTVAEDVQRTSATLRVDRTDQVIAVVPIPAVRLRTVFDDGQPAAGAEVMFQPWLVGSAGPLTSLLTDADGAVLLGMHLDDIPLHRYLDAADPPRVVRADILRIDHPAAVSPAPFTFEMPAGVRWADAGDVVLHRLAELHVLAVDHQNAPIRGAVFQLARPSQPTNSRGLATLQVADATQRTFRIGAPGALVERYEATAGSGSEHDPLRFELAPENRVVLHLECDDLRTDEVRLELVGPAHMFHGTTSDREQIPSRLHRAAGIGAFRSGRDRERIASFDDDLTFTLVSLVPGAQITATAIDAAGVEIARRTFVAPAFGDVRHVRMQPEVPLCRIDGRVVTADGEPVKASIVLGEERRRDFASYRARTSTDERGRFRLRLAATGAAVPVCISGDDHALLLESLSLVEGTQRPWFTLRPGHSLTARLVAHDGVTIDAAIEVPQQQELGVVSRRLPDISTRLERLPDGEVVLQARYACRTFTQRVDAAARRAPVEIRAPRPESVPLRVAAAVAPDTVLTLSIFSVADDADRMHLQLHCVDGDWQPARLPIYPGKYRVRCSRFEGGAVHETTWLVREGDTEPRWLMQ